MTINFGFNFNFNKKEEPPNFKKIVFENKDRPLFDKLEDYNNQSLMWAFKRAQIKSREMEPNKKNGTKKLGSVSLSNMDTVNRCSAIKARLNAKLGEIYKSDLPQAQKMTLARDVMFQMDKVEQKISEIRRREVAVREEKSAKKNEPSHLKRRRKRDMEKKTTSIKRGYLYSAEEGGYDPNNMLNGGSVNGFHEITPGVTVDISGGAVTGSDIAAAVSAGGAEVSAVSAEIDSPEVSVDVSL
jgi:hypothetical protein